ncbi:MAG: hypothetical protein V4773_20250 [Verrucomicrobiota bacterium]
MQRARFVSRAAAVGAALVLAASTAIGAADFTLTVNAGSVGKHVYPTMFGTNVVYNKITQAQWPTFISTFNALGMTTLRYSGGTVTEDLFDFKDSDGPNNDYISLSMFLQSVAANDITPLLVVPTKRFRNNYTTTGAQYAKDYVKAVNVDHGVTGGEQFGTTQKVEIWELGNEYYGDNEGGAPLSPTLYGQIAQKFATSMKTIDASIIPVVQFVRTDLTAAQTIANQLSGGAVEACLTHTYPGDAEGIGNVENQLINGSNIFSLEPMVTEWNMGSGSETGLVLATRIPKLFRELVDGGVTIATQWPMMWWNNSVNSALAQASGALRPPGQIFQWLSQCANNRKLVGTSSSSTAISSLAFKNPAGTKLFVLVLCANSLTDAQVGITINGFNGNNFTVVQAKRYSAAGGFTTELEEVTPATLRTVVPAKSNNVLTLTTNKYSKYEVIRIDLETP